MDFSSRDARRPDPSEKEGVVEHISQRDLAYFKDHLEFFIKHAAGARDYWADSHRGFKVGCAVLAWNKEKGYQWVRGSNFTPVPGHRLQGKKQCAERFALQWAEGEGDEYVIGIVIASNELQPDRHGNQTATIRPCADCCEMLGSSPLIKSNTLVVSIFDNKSGRVVEENEFSKL